MTRKMCAVAAVALLVVLTAFGVSSAEVMEFDYFTIDVPNGWKVGVDEENATVGFTAPDSSAALTVAVLENEGLSVEEYAEGVQDQLNGSNLQKINDGYMFQFTTENGVDAVGIMSGDEDYVMFISVIGKHEDFDAMINSMEATF